MSSRLGSLLLLFQRTPIVQMLFPQANILGGSSLGNVTLWTVATVTGLGAYDSVAGATTISQLQPNADSTTVAGTVGSQLSFIYQIIGTEKPPGTWAIIGSLPPGLTHTNSVGNTVDSIVGTPTTSGTYNITIRGYAHAGSSGEFIAQAFTFNITGGIVTPPEPPVIISQQQIVKVTTGSRARLVVKAQGTGLIYQWFKGASGTTTNPISGARSATFRTPIVTAKKKYWVRLSNTDGVVSSKTIVVSPK